MIIRSPVVMVGHKLKQWKYFILYMEIRIAIGRICQGKFCTLTIHET